MRMLSLEADGEADVSGRRRKGDWEAGGRGGGGGRLHFPPPVLLGSCFTGIYYLLLDFTMECKRQRS